MAYGNLGYIQDGQRFQTVSHEVKVVLVDYARQRQVGHAQFLIGG